VVRCDGEIYTSARIGITGLSTHAQRQPVVEADLAGQRLSPAVIKAAAGHAADGITDAAPTSTPPLTIGARWPWSWRTRDQRGSGARTVLARQSPKPGAHEVAQHDEQEVDEQDQRDVREAEEAHA
jgi:hypothetical protein